MEINRKTADAWISYWENYIGNYALPTWEQIPDFGLYMEQVVTFLKNCLSYMETSSEAESIITASAINNYVRKKIMPQPVKKRYYRTHIAYLIILCALKQSLSIAEIQSMIPAEAGEEELKVFYTEFTERHKRAAGFFIERVKSIKDMIVHDKDLHDLFKDNATEIVVDVALITSFAKVVMDRLISGESLAPYIGETEEVTPE
jgi:DNA-binding transcriptional MerR regulator